MLNRALHDALREQFGRVSVTNDGVARKALWDDRTRTYDVIERGEHYQVCCPFCGDKKFRLSFSHRYLSRGTLSDSRNTGLVNCYNMGCEQVYSPAFRERIREALDRAEAGLLLTPVADPSESGSTNRRRDLDLPDNCVPVSQLPPDHVAVQFLKSKYPGLPFEYLSLYNLAYCLPGPNRYRLAGNRIIFPIHDETGLRVVSWQGRTLEADLNPRWYNPPGFSKAAVFNVHRLAPVDVPIMSEGIPSAIACGPKGIAVYGTKPTKDVAEMLAARFSTVVLALDPDAYVPDNRPGGKGKVKVEETRKYLDRFFRAPTRLIRWPDAILEQARAYCNGETKVKPPDAADLGLKYMHEVLSNVAA